MSRALSFIFMVFLSGCTFMNVSLIPSIQPIKEQVIEGKGHPKILLLDISGVISEKEKSGGMGIKSLSMTAELRESLLKAEADPDVVGVIVRINSPGGAVTASDILYQELLSFKDRKKIPVYAHIMGIGTSGGYYVSTASDKIIVQPTSIVGGIGVISFKFNMEGLLTKVGIQEESIKSGDKKDIQSPLRASTPEEKEIMQTIIDKLHSRFVDVVFAQRKDLISRKDLETLSDGRIYSAEQAVSLRLVDSIGYLSDTVDMMKNSLGITEARVITYYRPGDYKTTIYSLSRHDSSILNLIDIGADAFMVSPEFLYLWMP
ncbi:MAG: signal peptide peptidase SppA [Nitrospirae bacterium]|nr:signal peptide peptidase SppA [Nitrospirota bacterium]